MENIRILLTVSSLLFLFHNALCDTIPDFNTFKTLYFEAESYSLKDYNYEKADSAFTSLSHLIDTSEALREELAPHYLFLVKYQHAYILSKRQHFHRTEKICEDALEIYNQNSNSVSEELMSPLIDNIYDLLVTTHRQKGLLRKAEKQALLSLDHSLKTDNPSDIFVDYISLASISYDLDDAGGVQHYFKKAEEILPLIPEKSQNQYLFRLAEAKLDITNNSDPEFQSYLDLYLQTYKNLDSGLKSQNHTDKIGYEIIQRRQKDHSDLRFIDSLIHIKDDLSDNLNIHIYTLYLESLLLHQEYDRAHIESKKTIDTYSSMEFLDWIFEPSKGQKLTLLAQVIAIYKTLAETNQYNSVEDYKNLINIYEHCLYSYLNSGGGDLDYYDLLLRAENDIDSIIDLSAVYLLQYPQDKELKNFVFSKLLSLKSISYKIHSQIKANISASLNQMDDLFYQERNLLAHIANLLEVESPNEMLEKDKVKFKKLLDQLQNQYPAYFTIKYNYAQIGVDDLNRYLPREFSFLNINIGRKYIISQLLQNGLLYDQTRLNDNIDKSISTVQEISSQGLGVRRDQERYREMVNIYQEESKHIYDLITTSLPLKQRNPIIVLNSSKLKGIDLNQLCNNLVEANNFSDLDYAIKSYNFINTFILEESREQLKEMSTYLLVKPNYKGIRLDKFGESEIVKGFDISENMELKKEEFIKNLSSYDLIHFSGHSISHDNRPEHSQLILNDLIESENLRGEEILKLQSRASLIFLSSCESYGKNYHNVEGVSGLSRIFGMIGAKNIISSQWKVHDIQSNNFSSSFYAYLSQGKNIRNALRSTKINILEQHDPILSHPYYWAAFTLHGLGEETMKQSPTNVYILSFIIIGFLLILLLYRYKKPARNHYP